ncbi:hypothetical protein WP50_21635 [Lactiplantibacillus plantarum]|nr:hypothetical protein WP50_21635 [Lactiplantibacillus plantarum]
MGYKKYNFNDQIVTAAKNIADRYNVEPKHRDLVTKFSLHLFDQLKPLHHLGKRERGVAPFATLFRQQQSKAGVEELSKADFQALYEDVLNASDQYLMDKYEVDEEDVRLIVPELLLINELLQLTNAEKIWLGNVTVLDGLIIQEAIKLGYKKYNFNDQIVTAAKNIADRYNVEPKHRDLVTKFSLRTQQSRFSSFI